MAYEKRQSYKFEVVEVNGDFVIVKSKEGNTYKVKLLDGLTAKDLPKKISCVVDSVFPDGNLKLIMDRNPFLREYYKVGKVYSFTVGAKRSRTVNTFYYPLRGVFGFMPQYPAPDGLVIPEGLQEFRVVEYDQKISSWNIFHLTTSRMIIPLLPSMCRQKRHSLWKICAMTLRQQTYVS